MPTLHYQQKGHRFCDDSDTFVVDGIVYCRRCEIIVNGAVTVSTGDESLDGERRLDAGSTPAGSTTE